MHYYIILDVTPNFGTVGREYPSEAAVLARLADLGQQCDILAACSEEPLFGRVHRDRLTELGGRAVRRMAL